MGLLKRFRASSSASNRAPLDNADFTAPLMPPPPIHTHSHLYASVSRASVADSMTPSTSASGMETPKSSKSFWKRKTKGKDKEGFGLAYESTSPSPAPPLPQSQPQYQGERSKNSSFVHVPAPRRELSQEGYRGREGSSTPKQELTPTGARVQPPQRAMLGRMDFEGQEQGQRQGFSHTPEAYNRQTTRTSSIPFGSSQQPQQANGRPVTAIYLERPKPQAPTPTAEPAGRMSQEEMEHLTSPEKRPINTPNTRRMSIQEEPGSPTPRKNTLPPQDLALKPKPSRTSSVDNHNALSSRRPSANRRNSFIPLNPFRSRGSMNDLDQPVEDDGSFQVMSFRHVSGASDYQDSTPKVEVEASPVNAFTQTPQPTSRPMSRAASLASLDDHIATAAKVSAGAFRKGVRRPSSTYIDNMDNDEDDDVPLGMLRHSGRENSSASLSSFKDGAKAPIQMRSPGRKPGQSVPTTPSQSRPSMPSSPNRPVEEKVISHTRSKTMPLISPDELHPNFPSPHHSPVGSSKAGTHPELPDTGYFAPVANTTTRRTPPPVADSPEFDFTSLGYPVSAFSTSPQATKTVPLAHKDLEALVTKTSGLAVSIPSPAGGSTLSSAISPAPIKQRQENDKLDEDLIIRSMAVYGEDTENEPPTPKVAIRQQSISSLYNESMSSDNSTIRSPLSERLGNLVGPRPMGRPSLVGLNTKSDDGGIKSPGSDATVSPVVAQTPRSSFARVTSQPLKGGSDSEGTATSEDEMPPPPPPTRPVNAPRSSFANAPPRPVSMFKPTRSQSSLSQAIKPNDDSDSEEDMPLARIKSKASRSSLAVAQSGMRPATIHSESPKPAKMSPPMSTSSATFARRASVPNAVAPLADSVLGQKLWDASPASSQSGLTGDSSSVQPITPSDREMDGKISRDGSFPPTPMYHAAIRPELAERPPSVMSSTSNMDDATRQRMKEMWQAQYMAAAHKAFEEEWERQSNVSGSVAPSVQSYSPYTPQPQPQPQQYQMPMSMPMGYNYPPQFQMYPPHVAHHQQMPWAPPPDHGQSMYAYGPSTQSVYGGEFGPPSTGMSSYRPMSMMGGFPASYSTTNLHQYSPQQMPTSQSSYFQSPPPQHSYTRSSSSHDLTPPKKGLINQIPSNSPKGVTNRRSQLGISVINADDRERSEQNRERERPGQAQPPTSWRRSTTVPVMDREDHSAPRRKRQSSYLVN